METDEEHDVDCAVEWFHFARRKFDRDAKGGRGAVGIGYYCMNIWGESELKLAWYREKISSFEHNFLIFLLSGNSNTSVFNVPNTH